MRGPLARLDQRDVVLSLPQLAPAPRGHVAEEFFDTTCHANDPADCAPITAGMATGINTLPPFGISCRSKIKWRNGHCPVGAAAEMGTELDWMVFLWNLNTVGPTPSPMTDVWKIYRHACNPPAAGQPPSNSPAACSGNEELSWSARPVLELTPARTCRWDKAQEDCQRGERCLNATVGSGATCTSASPSCVCKLPAVGGILEGAQRAYANDTLRSQNVAITGDSSGVSRDLSP
jgi:hypothetical protein